MKYIDHHGARVPALGFGTFRLVGAEVEDPVRWALATGYRHIDTAQRYDNEANVGKVLAESGIPRREIFLTTKLGMTNLTADRVASSFAESLDIDVDVRGGGFMGQAEAVKTAIAKALVGWTDSEELRKAYLGFDRNLLVDDVRRRETKKPLGRGARKKRQKSYR